MRRFSWVAALVLASAATAARAVPPYLTDDPAPTDTGHWEIYGFAAAETRQSDLDSEVGADLNYGAVKNVQVTATVPLSFTHNAIDGWHGRHRQSRAWRQIPFHQ